MTLRIQNLFAQLLSTARREEGQTMAEYGVILAVITLGIVGVLATLSTGIEGAIGDVVDRLTP